jgi:hypothetical protein
MRNKSHLYLFSGKEVDPYLLLLSNITTMCRFQEVFDIVGDFLKIYYNNIFLIYFLSKHQINKKKLI